MATYSDITKAIEEKTEPEINPETLPEEIRDLSYVFSKTRADLLPPHRAYDNTIPLQEGKEPPYGRLYNLSTVELEALRKYLNKNLKKSFIRVS
jgi:hypothetical protein